jgi:TrmH family RNA methyltransferase
VKEDKANTGAADQNQIKPYKKDADYSYTLGAFPTFELIKARPGIVRKVILDTGFTDQDKLKQLCEQQKLPYEFNNKLIAKLSDKENCYVAGVFHKYDC